MCMLFAIQTTPQLQLAFVATSLRVSGDEDDVLGDVDGDVAGVFSMDGEIFLEQQYQQHQRQWKLEQVYSTGQQWPKEQ